MMSSSNFASVPVAVITVTRKPTALLLFEKWRTVSHVRQIHAHVIKTNLLTDPLSVAKLMKAFSESSNPNEAISLYAQLLNSCFQDLRVIQFSVPSVLKACANSLAFEEGKQILGFVYKTHLWFDPFVTNSLVRMCMEVGQLALAREVFDKMPVRDLVSWNSLITGYVRFGEIEIAREVFDKMPHRDLVSCNAMIDGYGKHGMCELAEQVFNNMSQKDVVSFTSMISGFILDHRPGKGLSLFREMLCLGIRPDAPAIVNPFLPPLLTLVLLRRDMEREGIRPDDITFLGLLSACNHGGLMEEGQFHFETMQLKYKIVPKIQHYGCIIDLLGRAGRLEEAIGIIHDMPLEPDLLIWKVILSASMKHNNFVMGKTAALRAIKLAPQDSSCYVLLSNIYAKAGMWDEVTKVRSVMKKRRVKKFPDVAPFL
ncbi:putative tetratricopeptide-like helical domain-containing protein [Lupinus albus]|uniref:Putative tetratricopeptide-like helical domain-containing protein n=1 Tax=Lupinus albus TaxID=3870 RepID=A0A6A4NC26_LUPAL|nr:putative tetratricopeptide-like helical domain-containing protein [Lupinus albus]